MKTARWISTLLVTAASIAALGAAPPVTADFTPAEVEHIAVLGVADLRIDKSVEFKKLDRIGHRAVQRRLKKSTYTLDFVEALESSRPITGDELEDLDGDWIRTLGPTDERYVMLLVLEDAARKNTLGAAFGAVCSGYLFDRETGDVLWSNQTTGTMGQGGLAGMMMNNAMRGGAFEDCTGNLLFTFPWDKRSKKDRKKNRRG